MKATIEIDDELYRQVKALRSSHTGLRTCRIQLPIVKSKKPGSLRLSSEMIAEAEAQLDSGRGSGHES